MHYTGDRIYKVKSNLRPGEPNAVSLQDIIDHEYKPQLIFLTTKVFAPKFWDFHFRTYKHAKKIIMYHGYKDEVLRLPDGAILFSTSGHPILHSKLMLIEYPDILRVVVTSANFNLPDWSILGQNVWICDFEKKLDEIPKSQFHIDLEDHLVSIFSLFEQHKELTPIKKLILRNLNSHELTVPSYVHLACVHPNPKIEPALHKIRSLLSVYQGNEVMFGFSSFNTLKDGLIDDILDATRSTHITLMFPSRKYVDNAEEGEAMAQYALCPYTGSFNNNKVFLAEPYLYPALPKQEMVSHAKVMTVTHRGEVVMVYAGSANLSRGAWGSLKNTECFQYELGVILLNHKEDLSLYFDTETPLYDADNMWKE